MDCTVWYFYFELIILISTLLQYVSPFICVTWTKTKNASVLKQKELWALSNKQFKGREHITKRTLLGFEFKYCDKCFCCSYFIYFTYLDVCVFLFLRAALRQIPINCVAVVTTTRRSTVASSCLKCIRIPHVPHCHAHWDAPKAAVLDRPELEFPPDEPNLHVCSCVYGGEIHVCEPADPTSARERRVPAHRSS